jgi:hypothetical protein
VVITLVWSSKEFPLKKFGLGLVAKFSLGVYSGEAKGFHVLHMCALVLSCVIKGHGYIVCCTSKPALSSLIYFVRKNFHNCVIFYFVVP